MQDAAGSCRIRRMQDRLSVVNQNARIRHFQTCGAFETDGSSIGSPSAMMTTSKVKSYAAFFAALIARHLLFAAREIARLPFAVIFLFGFADSACVGSESCRSLEYLARCARAILFLTAADRFLRSFVVPVEPVASVRLPPFNI